MTTKLHSYTRCLQIPEPIFSPREFAEIIPMSHIDCSHQEESTQSGSVVMRIEFETSEAVPDDTTAYCLTSHDKLFNHSPLTKIVKQLRKIPTTKIIIQEEPLC